MGLQKSQVRRVIELERRRGGAVRVVERSLPDGITEIVLHRKAFGRERQPVIVARYRGLSGEPLPAGGGISEDYYQPFGKAVDMWNCQEPEILIAGPAETGKSLACLHKLNFYAWKYPGAHILIVRKTRVSMLPSVLKTFSDKVLGDNSPVIVYGGNSPQWYDYPNGSRIVVGGMDKADRWLSAEYDLIFVNQAEELTLDDVEKLTTRATGRAGHGPYSQVILDANPGASTHWLRQRKGLTWFESRHEENPTLFDQDTGEMTSQGERTLATLDRLTGVRKARLRYGRWSSAEGAIYQEFDESVHVIDRFPIPADWRIHRAIDFGYQNPFVCLWFAEDGDGRLHMFRELYMSQRLVEDHADQINQLTLGIAGDVWERLDDSQKRKLMRGEKVKVLVESDGQEEPEEIEISADGRETITSTVADHDAEGRETLARYGISTTAADKRVSLGIQAVQSRLRVQEDGKPRIFFMRDSLVEEDELLRAEMKPTRCVLEFPDYRWKKVTTDGVSEERPVKANDHALDPVRYLVMELDGLRPMIETAPNPFYG